METHIGLSSHTRNEVAKLLQALLADEYVMYTKALKFHWNVYGMHFHDYHKFFKEQYEALLDIADEIAERIRALGLPTAATLKEFSQITRQKEEIGSYPDAYSMITIMLADQEQIIRQLRQDIETCAQLGDMGTNNFLTDIMELHEKFAWMLRATASK